MDDPKTGAGSSLWLVPENPVRARLVSCIEALSKRLGTPAFPPHVTLLSGLALPEADVVGATAALARGLVSFAIRLGGIEGTEAYFRCLYARADGEDALREAHALASRAFGREPDASFEPHLSLVYGTLAPATKAALARELDELAHLSFEVRRLHVWRTAGEVAEWRANAAFELGAQGL